MSVMDDLDAIEVSAEQICGYVRDTPAESLINIRVSEIKEACERTRAALAKAESPAVDEPTPRPYDPWPITQLTV